MQGTKQNKGNFILKNGDEFEGELQDWKLNGTIKYKFKTNEKFKAEFSMGKIVGNLVFQDNFSKLRIEKSPNEARGKIMFKDKSVYEGDLDPETNIPQGKGTLRFSEQSQSLLKEFTGGFNKGVIQSGTLLFKNGDIYTGIFNNDGLFHGEGELNLEGRGVKIEGEFLDGVIITGRISYSNGDEYAGDIKGFKAHGKGVYKFKKTGDIYKGSFIRGQKSGKGKIVRQNGNWIYDGDFDDDTLNGNGAIETPEYILKGFFFEGELEGEYEIIDKKTDKVH